MAPGPPRRVCLGVIVGAHGVRGQARIRSFTARPADLAAYGPLEDETGARRFEVTVTGSAKDVLVARIAGVREREAAEALKGTRLYVDRAALPALEAPDEYYQADLIGLAAEDREGRRIGRVAAVHNFGAGDVLEIERPEGEAVLLPFTRAAVPVVDLAAGRLVLEPPAEVEAAPE